MSLYAEMREFAAGRPDTPPEHLGTLFCRATTTAALRSLLAAEFARIRRQDTRVLEVEEMTRQRGEVRELMSTQRWSERLRSTPYALGDGSDVPFGRLTVAQHRVRIVMLEKHRAGIDRTIAVHNEAIADIEAAGVECLDDLSVAAVAA